MKNIIIVIAVVLVLAVGYLVINWNGSDANEAPALDSTPEAQTPNTSVGSSASTQKIWPVNIQNFSFPQFVIIKKGDAVSWTNKDSALHSVVSDNGDFASPTLKQNDAYVLTFNKAGNYNYHCSFHPAMLGTVIVK